MSYEEFNVQELSSDQKQGIVNLIKHEFGSVLSEDKFEDCVLLVFEDISGFECASDSDFNCLINQLWSKYHEAPHKGKISSK